MDKDNPNKLNPLVLAVFSAFVTNYAYADIEPYVNVNSSYQFADDHSYKGDDIPQAIGFGIGGGVYITPAIDWSLNLNKPMDLEADKTKVNIEAFFTESALSYHYVIDKRKGLYLGLGGAYWYVDKEFGSRSTNGHGFSPLAKIGVTFSYNDNVMFDMGYKYIDSVGNNVIGEYDSHNVIFGVSYKFASNPVLQDSIEDVEFIEEHQDESLSEESVISEPDEIIISDTFFTEVYFDFDDYQLSKSEVDALNLVVTELNTNAKTQVRLVGYTDIVGTEAYNLNLSVQRAESVKKLLEGMYPNFNYEVVGCGKNECLDELSETSKPRSAKELRRVDVYVQ
ncbi:TPA: OmpA family protein [Vibrio harveyi]